MGLKRAKPIRQKRHRKEVGGGRRVFSESEPNGIYQGEEWFHLPLPWSRELRKYGAA